MSEPELKAATPAATGAGQDGAASPGGALPAVSCALTPAGVLERLATASRRGRLAGFENHAEPNGVLFSVAAFGQPFDGVLNARGEAGAGGTTLRFEERVLRRNPAIFVLALAFTVWPGVYFMDQLMIQFLPGVRDAVPTAWWYLPITVVPIPWLWRTVMRRTRAAVRASALHSIERIAAELDGRLEAATR